MAKFRIEQPDGKVYEIEGPDDLSQDQIVELARRNLPQEFAGGNVQVKAPEQASMQQAVNDPESELLSDVGTGFKELATGVAEGGANVLDRAAGWLQSGLNKAGQTLAGSNWGDALSGQGKLVDNFAPAREGYGLTRGAGRFVGEAVASSPLAALRGGALVQGAAGGALLSNGNSVGEVAQDAAIGGAAGGVLSGLLRAGSRIAAPNVPNDIRALLDAGIRVTPGQLGQASGSRLGQIAARTEERAASTPFVGSMIDGARARSLDDFGRAAVNRSLEPIGLSLPQNVRSGRQAIRYAGDRISAAYDALLPNLTVQGDQQFLTDLGAIHAEAQTLAPGRADQFNRILEDLNRFWGGNTTLDGQALKRVEERLGQRIRRYTTSSDADTQDLGDLLGEVQQALREAAARQNPAEAAQLRAINQGYKSLVQAERASLNSRGEISPNGYSQAVKRSSDTVRNRGYARGEALNQDLSDPASAVLPSRTANSGTSDRQQAASLTANLMGLAQAPFYAGAQVAVPVLTRQRAVSPGLGRLLEYGAAAAPIAAPAAVDQLR